ncbi:unnamed protein product [Caenorhabditis auriculariae]|uniref:Anaphase-promoting complex subunit 4 WD40 domain-containing protein n=1 Tax=Caenorhabditis auriculariae TaxID=2777116 RepID=A0A8S1HAS3_9PELO|nr:unnamed protein product [Caenorhabditis auriculariae]
MSAELFDRNFGYQCPEELEGSLDLQNGCANCCKFNRWGTLVAVGSTDGRVYIFDFITKGMVKSWPAHALPVSALCWSRDGRKLLSASADTTIAIWDVLSGAALHKIKFASMVTYAAFNPRDDNKFIVLQVAFPPTVEHLQPRAQRVLTNDIPGANDDSVSCMSYDRKAKFIITGTAKGKIIIYDATTYRCVSWCRQNSLQQIRQIHVPLKSRNVLTNSQDRIIRTYSLEDLLKCQNGSTVEPKYKVQDMVNKTAWKSICTDSDGVFTCGASSKNHSLYIWEACTGSLIKILHGTKGESLLDVQWHPSRPVVLSVAQGVVSLWTQAHVENWSAFAPEFRELEENGKYEEKEEEFDMEDEDADDGANTNDQDGEEDEIDVVTLQPEEFMASSDEEDVAQFIPDATLKSGPLWFIPLAPEIENPESIGLDKRPTNEVEEEKTGVAPAGNKAPKGRKPK